MRLSIRQYAYILDKALSEASTDSAKEKIMNEFASALVSDGKSSRLGEIIEIWKTLYNKRHGLLDVEVVSADKDSVGFPHSFAGKKVALSVKEDSTLIGGSIVKVGDYIIDGSLKTKIASIRQ